MLSFTVFPINLQIKGEFLNYKNLIFARGYISAKYGSGHGNLMFFPKAGMILDSPKALLKNNSPYDRAC